MERRFNYTSQKDDIRDLGNNIHDEQDTTFARMPFNETDEFFNNPASRVDYFDDDKEAFKRIFKQKQQKKRENFTNTLLFQNKFVDPEVHDVRNNDDATRREREFRQYIENRMNIENKAISLGPNMFDIASDDLEQQSLLLQDDLAPDDLLLTNGVNGIKNLEAENVQAINQQASDEDRFFKNRRTLINVDSRDRDKTIYPFHNRYKIDLGREFTNVKKIIMRSSEFPNTEQLIRDTPINKANNKIYWKNGNSNDIFTASIPPGNYRPSSLQTQIQTSMNQVRRDEDNFHEFTVSVDTVSDTCTFSSLSSRQVAAPFFTTAGTSIIEVRVDGHGFSDGQLVNISGSTSFAGINLALINTNHTVTVIDADKFTIDIGVNIVVTAGNDDDGGVGGNQVRIGTGLDFQLLWSLDGTIANILGFENVDTAFSTLHSNTVIDKTFTVERVKSLDTIYSAVLIDSGSITTENPFEFLPADPIYLVGVSGTSSDELVNIASGYNLTFLTSFDQITLGWTDEQVARAFKIPAPIESSSDGLGGVVNTRTLNRPVTLAGENYLFMQILPQQNIIFGDFANSGFVDNIFCKIDLSAPPGNILYNTFISNGRTFLETPLKELRELEFQFKDQNNALFDFIDAHHSFTLEIVEQIHRLESSGIQYNSRLGVSDKT